MAQSVIQFYTAGFFEELARRLNADEDWGRQMKGQHLRINCTASDRQKSFLISIEDGRVSTQEVTTEVPADFRLEGPYKTWVQLCKGEWEIDQLIQTGRIRLAGSMPDAMRLMGPLNLIVLTARSFPKEF
ncbi:MAG: SCP2 sterol-binding domain-containing protein [Candidatus Thermoplasmatota archaeon]